MKNGKLLGTLKYIMNCEEFENVIMYPASLEYKFISIGYKRSPAFLDNGVSIHEVYSSIIKQTKKISKSFKNSTSEISLAVSNSSGSYISRNNSDFVLQKPIKTNLGKIYFDKSITRYYAEINATSERHCWEICINVEICVASLYLCKRCFLFDQTLEHSEYDSFKVYSKIDLSGLTPGIFF